MAEQRVFITGASSGIGEALARHYASQDSAIGLAARRADLLTALAANMGHGDTDNIILLPGSVNECFEFGWRAFDIAERIQTPVLVLSDLDFGMNQWMSEPFKYPDVPMDRGKILWEEDIKKLTEPWGRYFDKDGDGIPYRTLPGTDSPRAAYLLSSAFTIDDFPVPRAPVNSTLFAG